jgi:hypothetical protein
MKTSSIPLSLSYLLLGSSIVFIAGCGGMTSLPDTVIVPHNTGAPLQGSVFGGHAPIVGAEVFVLQAGTSGYASQSVNIMGSGNAGTDPNYGKYVLTASDGSFNISGDYACTPGSGGAPGLPVYIVAFGGAPYVAANGGGSTPATIQITAEAPDGQTASSAFILQFTGNNLLYPGQTVKLTFPNTSPWAVFNGNQTVYTANSTSFTITNQNNDPAAATGSGTATLVPTPPTPNPAIANVAVLGNCPTPGNFSTGGPGSDVISFVNLNEISSVAAAYALSGFGSGPFYIGIPSGDALAQAGIKNAANNAGQLFNIQNPTPGNLGVPDGEGYVANLTTPVGNGTVTQATIDTLGNILASCVDSPNTASSASTSCSTLFEYATSNGVPNGGILAKDTFTAAINIAHYPGGNPSTNNKSVGKLFTLQSAETTPFSPALPSSPTPNDFTVAIQFPVGGKPESIAVDASGNYWYTALVTAASQYPCTGSSCGASIIAESSPLGASLYTHSQGSWIYGDVTVDSVGDAWTGNQSGYEVSTKITPGSPYQLTNPGSTYTYGAGPVADDNGDVFYAHGPTAGYPQPGTDNIELSELGAHTNGSPFICSSFSAGAGCTAPYYNVRHGAIDPSGDLWLISELGSIISRIPSGTITGAPALGFPIGNPVYPSQPCTTAISYPEQPAIDASGNAWIPINGNGSGSNVLEVSSAGNCALLPVDTAPYGAAVDGADYVWVSNNGGNDITEINASTGAVNQTNYTVNGILNGPTGLAVDLSGDLLIANYNASTIVEVIGAAAPTFAPLGVAAGSVPAKLGAKP